MQDNNINDVIVSVPRSEKDNVSIRLATWNCHGLKSGIEYATSLAVSHDITFLCEHWLLPNELHTIKEYFANHGRVAYMASSVDCSSVLVGRPYGGTGFVIKESEGFSYRIEEYSERVMGLKVYHKQQTILNVFGIYLPHDGYQTQEQNHLECYLETVDLLQSLIDICTSGSSVMILGDMTTCLPSSESCHRIGIESNLFPREVCCFTIFSVTMICAWEILAFHRW